MRFNLPKTIEILERTPIVLEHLLDGISDEWLMNNEGGDSWSPFDIVGHLIHGEKTDWIPRAKIILSDREDKTFIPFDRFAQMDASKSKDIQALLEEFKTLRIQNLEELKSLPLNDTTLKAKGIHPDLGESRLSELLSTWTVHDLGHIAQISRVMAKQYKSEVGPWKKYLGILKH